MEALNKALRSELERAITKAREVSEKAAGASLHYLGVGEKEPFSHLTEKEKELRESLRIHGRQLGDTVRQGIQSTEILTEEIAYEHWHRMLFSRFLAENSLLMYPEISPPISITLEECEELAKEKGARNGWELASRYAAEMLPQIFRIDSPIFALEFSVEYKIELEKILSSLNAEVFFASDSLGWVYQFWQSKRKDEINKSEEKIGSRELPPVTQLFTEPYMVSFLLDNSLGAWWARKRLTSHDLESAESEVELREKASLKGVPFEYLRFVKDEKGFSLPNPYQNWPESLQNFSVLDPCSGSGHFLVAVFLYLVPMRMELENLSESEAVDRVLRENIHGLDIDRRVTEIAAFSLAFTAWKYPNAGGYRKLPELQIACTGLSVGGDVKSWVKLAGKDQTLKLVMEQLYYQFRESGVLGSLIDPLRSMNKGELFEIASEKVQPLLETLLSTEKDRELVETGVVASGLSKAAFLLSRKHNWVLTNVPYLIGAIKVY